MFHLSLKPGENLIKAERQYFIFRMEKYSGRGNPYLLHLFEPEKLIALSILPDALISQAVENTRQPSGHLHELCFLEGPVATAQDNHVQVFDVAISKLVDLIAQAIILELQLDPLATGLPDDNAKAELFWLCSDGLCPTDKLFAKTSHNSVQIGEGRRLTGKVNNFAARKCDVVLNRLSDLRSHIDASQILKR